MPKPKSTNGFSAIEVLIIALTGEKRHYRGINDASKLRAKLEQESNFSKVDLARFVNRTIRSIPEEFQNCPKRYVVDEMMIGFGYRYSALSKTYEVQRLYL